MAVRKVALALIWGRYGLSDARSGGNLLKKAAEGGDREAQLQICTMPVTLLPSDCKPNQEICRSWLSKIAYGGNAFAARSLGDFFGISGNEAEKLKWYRLASELGDEEAFEAIKSDDYPSLDD